MASKGTKTEDQRPPRVVILGGGYGGVYTALNLQKAARRGQIDLSLVSRDNFFLYQPMLAEVVSGSIEPPHIVNPIRRLLPHTDFYQAEVDAIDVENRAVIVRYSGGHAHLEEIPYDHLVIAVGSSTDLSRIPGMAEYAFPFKTLGDGFSLRNHLIGVMESAEVENDAEEKRELLTFVVVGGGYTGVEVAAEINAFVREASQSYRHVNPEEVKVILLQGGNRILPELNEEQATFSHRLLERRGIEVRLNTLIKGATAQSAILSNELEIPTRTLVAAIGSAPNRLLDTLPCTRDTWGRVVVDETLTVPECPGIWAVG
ncbi:MAG: FAD-dependent oxidoreductase, partial [Dehalococcoidia bacterium]